MGWMVGGRDDRQGQMACGVYAVAAAKTIRRTQSTVTNYFCPRDGLHFDMKCAIMRKLRLLGPRSVNCTVQHVGTTSRVCSFCQAQERPIHPDYWLQQIVAHHIAQPQPYEQRRCTSHSNPNCCWRQTTIGQCIDFSSHLLLPFTSVSSSPIVT